MTRALGMALGAARSTASAARSTVDDVLDRRPSLATRLRLPGPAARSLVERVAVLAQALDAPARADTAGRLAFLADRLSDAGHDEWWLTLAVLTGHLPEEPDVVRAVRHARARGTGHALDEAVAGVPVTSRRPLPSVQVVTGEVLVDLAHTSRTRLATGIQRVARLTAARWDRDHDVRLVGWTDGGTALRLLSPSERRRALTGQDGGDDQDAPHQVVVPWRATYLLPELAPERARNRRLMAMAQWSRSRTGVIGFDCVPVSSAETTDANVSEAFINNLAAVRHFSAVAGISEAAAGEYRGWRRMLGGIGESGPAVTAVVLPVERQDVPEEVVESTRARLTVTGLPLVLCVGTHEPRKNHLAVLHAAEVLWRRGVRFGLTFIGGHSWRSETFDQGVAGLRAAGRPVETLTSVTDDELWAAYGVAHCVVFPSLNEGYGLPVAEALASGTPVVTSGFGSMAEIAAQGGAVLVDPRDDESVIAGLASVLTDRERHAQLRREAAQRPRRTWDDYARETWDLFVTAEGEAP